MITAPDAIVIGLRALSFIALFQAAGCALFLWLFRHHLQTTKCGLARLARVATYGAIVFTIAHHFLGPARMTGSFGDVFDLSLQVFLLESSAGPARIQRIAGLILILFGLRATSELDYRVMLLGVAVTLGSFALMGHTTTHAARLVLAPLLLLHVAIIAFWFGSLLPLIHVTEAEEVSVSSVLLRRFSSLATWSVPLILIAGAATWYLLIPGFTGFPTPYSKMILGKVTGFSLLIALATLNKWRYVPGVRSGDAASLIALRRSIAQEWSIMAVIFIVTALLTGLFSPD